jgi:hypothetical protein
VAALNNGANSQVTTFLKGLDFNGQNIFRHRVNIIARQG